jgi:hypothetical protein
MKIIVLHGNDTQKSYERLMVFVNEAKKRNWKITEFSLEEVENQSLFGEECFYVLHDYKLLDKKIIEKLKKYNGNLIIYNAGKIPAPTLKNLNPDKTELFELPQPLWKFLDNMTIAGFHKLLETQAPEYLLAMIAWKFKQNYLKNPSEKNAKLISELAEIDVNSKTGKADLALSLDLLIVKQLK